MRVFKYQLKLIDSLFYSKEGLSGATSPKYLHATALNHSVAYALGINPEAQPYIISEGNRGRNTPRYENSVASQDFYFTPGRPIGDIRYIPEIAKGEDDDFVRIGYGAYSKESRERLSKEFKIPVGNVIKGRQECLKASQLFSIPPESIFEGFLTTRKEIVFPLIIRLGSFRGKAFIKLEEVKALKKKDKALVAHPVDPLVSKTIRGMLIGMFPYPIVENAICERCIEIKCDGFSKFIALPDIFDFSDGSIKKTPQIAVI